MTGRKMRFLSPILGLVLCGCMRGMSILGGIPPDNEAILARGLTCAVPPPSAVGDTVSAAQSLTIYFADNVYSFDAQIQITPKEFDLVALDNLGRRAMTITWHDGQIYSSHAPWFPAFVRPADILADVAIVYFPADAITPALSGCNAKLTTNADGRTVARGDEDLITVTYDAKRGWSRTAHLHNISLGFRIDIKSVDLTK